MSNTAVILDPYATDFQTWGTRLVEAAGLFLPAPFEPWQDWAARVYEQSGYSGVPQPTMFDDWQDWAARVKETFVI